MTCPDYNCYCRYATYQGDCKKPRSRPCPCDDADMAAYEDALERKYEEMRDARICAEEE